MYRCMPPVLHQKKNQSRLGSDFDGPITLLVNALTMTRTVAGTSSSNSRYFCNYVSKNNSNKFHFRNPFLLQVQNQYPPHRFLYILSCFLMHVLCMYIYIFEITLITGKEMRVQYSVLVE